MPRAGGICVSCYPCDPCEAHVGKTWCRCVGSCEGSGSSMVRWLVVDWAPKFGVSVLLIMDSKKWRERLT
jgi:hypothetical protein